MLVKGIIVSMAEDVHQAYITIPIFDNSTSKIDFKNVNKRLATICTLPGCDLLYSIGDVVYVDFEQDNQEYPVILGRLYRDGEVGSISNITAHSLKVNVNTELSNDTSIGDLSYDNLNNPSYGSSSNYEYYDGSVSIDGEDIPIGGTSGIFWCTYGETTSHEIKTAIETGKLCCVVVGTSTYVYLRGNSSKTVTYFGNTSNTGVKIVICSSDEWSSSDAPYSSLSSAPVLPIEEDIAINAYHIGYCLVCNPTQDVTISIPHSSFTVGAELEIMNISTYTITIQGGTDVLVNGVNTGSKTLSSQYASAVLKYIDNYTWVVQGAVS